ncbi:protein serine/threonine phosphatase [Candidatus Koribacter versatilis Ellin345]|uniref:Protein serine/threonine phosphatase n=1 Tax=Koribacter versatilis (strain Ellin345) TaxID=204669 RepID=Q1IIH0_KORVE|nr:protein phosphatase 2C domain-containing protein [Candidatus Koribacter versatilis]ABF43330.1 protein serine/threonine phosphatase [Candidatus Koribacter versatilis Ellin345]
MSLLLEVAGRSDVGCVRANNEDNFGYDTRYGIFVVCDGMGGQAAGEVASKLGVDSVLGFFRDQSRHETSEHSVADVTALTKHDSGATPRAKLLSGAIVRANTAIHEAAEKNANHSGMGSTVAAVLVEGDFFTVGNVGDSRVYLIREGKIEQLTNDHSLVAEHVRRGLMTKEQANRSEVQNVLLQALGSDDIDPDLDDFAAAHNDILLIATDGLTKHVSEDGICKILLAAANPQVACDALVEAARLKGGDDNITCLVLRFVEQTWIKRALWGGSPKWQDSF